MTIIIRPPATIKEYEVIEWLQTEIWGPIGVAPRELLLTMAKEGGVVLLAFDDDKPIGFAYGFLGLAQSNRLKLASHQAGVLPAYQDHGVGYQLKLAQREAVLAKNLDQITWTFDPLQGRNARFNLRKLGAVCNTYFQNLYGEMTDALNQGLPSDRFRVDWWLASDHVTRRLRGEFTAPELSPAICPVLNPGISLEAGVTAPAGVFALPESVFCLVEIPTNLALLKQRAPELALQWRLQTREIFETAFRQGYTAVDMLRREERNYYLLQKDWQA